MAVWTFSRRLAELGRRLRERRAEIEEAIFTRLPAADGEELARGQREAIRSCLELVTLVFEQDGGWDDLRQLPVLRDGGAFGSRPLRRCYRNTSAATHVLLGLRARGDQAAP